MRSILKNIFFLLLCGGFNSPLFATGVCFHCEEIRENNRLHPHNYEYYDDYLEEQQLKTADETKPPVVIPSKRL